MDTARLTDKQLYQLMQNTKLHRTIRTAAGTALNRRMLLPGAPVQFRPVHSAPQSLRTITKILIILSSLLLLVHLLIAGRLLAKGGQKKWDQYQICLLTGICLWSVVVLLWARYYFRPVL